MFNKLTIDTEFYESIEVDVIVEISKGGHIKYEYDKERNILVCDRILHTPFRYPFNYGFIPNTLSEDGDPIDVVILLDDELIPGCMIRCKILGYLETEDDAGNDPKLIVCPIEKVDPKFNFNNYFSISNGNINYNMLEQIKYFFQHYKDLENKKVKVGELKNKNKANKVYKESVDRYNNQKLQKIQSNKITNYYKNINQQLVETNSNIDNYII
jgi:inorganic pyrophosphatase